MDTVEQLDPAAYVGVDWASEDHAVCVLGVDGRKKNAFAIEHGKDGLAELVKRLKPLGPAGRETGPCNVWRGSWPTRASPTGGSAASPPHRSPGSASPRSSPTLSTSRRRVERGPVPGAPTNRSSIPRFPGGSGNCSPPERREACASASTPLPEESPPLVPRVRSSAARLAHRR